jgi:peptidoglycan/xylan/chitin deacetylase (PgdA/CDA1 family)
MPETPSSRERERVAARDRARRRDRRRLRLQRGAALVLGVAVIAILVGALGLGRGSPSSSSSVRASTARRTATAAVTRPRTAATAAAARPLTGPAGHVRVPILTYHVIAPPPAGAPFPKLYVTATQFEDQIHALAAAGWHGVTLDQLQAYWTRGVRLPPGRPIVLTFDNGYRSQYAVAMPRLRALGWRADENIQLSGLPPSQGGLTRRQVRALLAAGWELDTQGFTHADLVTLSAAQLEHEVARSRQVLRRRFGVPVNWFCYPSGHYDATVIRAVRAAGYTGSTTTITGWASSAQDRYRLQRIRVLGGTSGAQLLALLRAARPPVASPPAYTG